MDDPSNVPAGAEEEHFSHIEWKEFSERFDILDVLGEGGMGRVLKVFDRKLKSVRAVKRMLPDFVAKRELYLRFLREAQSAARLNHENVVQVYDICRDGEGPYLVLEFVDGQSLAQRIEAGAMAWRQGVELLLPICAAVGVAHHAGIVHRDIKPHNILLTRDGRPKLGDFGLARELAAPGLTITNVCGVGSPGYMAPEQGRDLKNVDKRADIYSLAATLYHMVTGNFPALIMADDIPVELRSVILQGLQQRRERRQDSVEQFATQLKDALGKRASVLVPDSKTVPSAGAPRPSPPREEHRRGHQPPPLLMAPFSAAEARTAQEAWAMHLGKSVVETNSIGMSLTLIPPGEFRMGSPDTETGRRDDETLHAVRLTRAYRMGACPVTQGEFQEVLGRNPSHFRSAEGGLRPEDLPRLPVETVTWFDAVKFCNRLSNSEGLPAYYKLRGVKREDAAISAGDVNIVGGNGYRLPTEAEWEYACRAGTVTAFHFGDVNDGAAANVKGNYPYGTNTKVPYLQRTSVVGSYDVPNGFGLYDLHGNVWEWCGDWYDADFYRQAKEIAVDPFFAIAAEVRVLRGGSWSFYARSSRSAYRYWSTPDARYYNIGLRIARTELP